MSLTIRLAAAVPRCSWWALCRAGRLGLSVSILLVRLTLRLLTSRDGTFGSARWATTRMLRRAGALGDDGLILAKAGRRLLRDANSEGSELVLAPQGAGKGVGPVISNLLDYPGSVLCTDPKGENTAVTARYRASLSRVIRLDIGDTANSDNFNPMTSIRWGTVDETDDAEQLADLMLVPDLKEESHWRRRSLAWLTGFILHVGHAYRETPELVSLAQVNELVNAGNATFKAVVAEMARSDVPKVAETAAQIAKGGDSEETRNILSNLVKGTEVWSRGKPLARISGQSDFSFEDLYRETVTVYLVVPEEKLAIYGAFLRVMTGLALNGVLRAGRTSLPPRCRPLFLLDEAAALGYLEPLEQGMGYLRAYARAMLIFQDLGQLEATYPRARSLMANAATLVAFGVNDMATARLISERVGQTTVAARNAGASQARDEVLAHRLQAGTSEAGRALIHPDEVMNLGADEVLVFMGRRVPAAIRARRTRYFEERRFTGRYDAWRDGRTIAANPDITATVVAEMGAAAASLVRAQPLARKLCHAG
ncbi:MAG: type IV secretory system conjugative DNA transfer family protein [Hyphomicrobiaceae bacterium]